MNVDRRATDDGAVDGLLGFVSVFLVWCFVLNDLRIECDVDCHRAKEGRVFKHFICCACDLL